MLSDNERRRFDEITGELGQDDNLIRLEERARRKTTRKKSPRARRRTITEWAEQRFEERMRRDRDR